jgi:ribosomal protein L11 methyltransferase
VSWYSLTADIPHAQLEECESLLHDASASGLEVRDGPSTMPNVRAPAAGQAIVVAYFERKAQATKAKKAVEQQILEARCAVEAVEERDWSQEWKARINSVEVGRLWVGPPWQQPPAGKVAITIEPKMAFGTGDHPTTTLCLQAVDDFLSAHPGASVLDVGTGTGVLAFAAKKLGASRVVAVDNDPVSVELATEAARENGVAGIDISAKSLKQVSGSFDLVVANILANTLIDLSSSIVPKVKERLVLAGVLVPQAVEVRAAYEALGLRAQEPAVRGEWIRLDFTRA